MIQFLSASVMAIGSVVGFVGLELATSLLYSGYSFQPLEIFGEVKETLTLFSLALKILWCLFFSEESCLMYVLVTTLVMVWSTRGALQLCGGLICSNITLAL